MLHTLDCKLILDTRTGILEIKLEQCKEEIPIECAEVSLMAVGAAGCYECAAGTTMFVSFVEVCFW
jgi:hypothetical protein